MIGNLDPHTPARVIEALILDLGFEDVVVVAGPLIRDTKAYAFINAPPTVNVCAMITALKASKLFDRPLEVEMVGSLSSLDSDDATTIDNIVKNNIAGHPPGEGVRSLEENHGEKSGEKERRGGPQSVSDKIARYIDRYVPDIATVKDRPMPGTNDTPLGIIATRRQDSAPKLSREVTNASQANSLLTNTTLAAPAPIDRRLFSYLKGIKPVEDPKSVVTDQQHIGSSTVIEGCKEIGQA
jgi:hypothetical protein